MTRISEGLVTLAVVLLVAAVLVVAAVQADAALVGKVTDALAEAIR
jgi:hypothetical protein